MSKTIATMDKESRFNSEVVVKEGGLPVQGSPSKAEALALSGDETGTWYALRIGVGGDVKVDYRDGGTGITLKNVPDGGYEPGIFTKVYQTGTTATDIVAYEYT